MSFGKKLGHTFLGFSPLPLSLAIQFILIVPFLGISFAYCFMRYPDNSERLSDALSKMLDSASFNTIFLLTCAILIIFFFGLWYFHVFEPLCLKPAHLKKTVSPLMVIGIVVLALGLQYTVSYVIAFTSVIRPDWLTAFEELSDSAGMNDMTLLLALYSVLFGPINEELLFRGVSLSHLCRAMPFWIANVIQAALFGIFHLNMLQGIYAFLLGLFFGYIRHVSKSIYPSMLLHIIYNFFACFLTGILFYNETSMFLICFRFILAVMLPIAGTFIFLTGIKNPQKQGE